MWLTRGRWSDTVRKIQGLLYQAGLYDGRIDGYFGGVTERAVKDWQRQIGVLPDGKWGIKTIDATMKELAKVNDRGALAAGKPAVVPTKENG